MKDKITDFLNDFPEIETDRLFLKRHYIEEIDDIYLIFSSDKVTKFLHKHENIEATTKFVNKKIDTMFNGTKREWVIEDKLTNKIIGVFDLKFDIDNSNVEVSYVLGDKYWKKGYMTEVLKKMINICFNELCVNRVEAECFSKNVDSIKLLKKIGMKHEGTKRQASFNVVTKQYLNFEYYGMLKEEYNVK